MSKLPTTRAEAKAAGLSRYNTGKPCKHGHIADRFTSTANCVVCSDISRKKVLKRKIQRRGKLGTIGGRPKT